MRVTEEFSTDYVQPILDNWDIPSGIGSGTGSVGAPIGGGYSTPSAPAYDTYQAPSYGGKPPGALEDGLGHWWNEATQQWENDSGGAYVAPQPDLSSVPQGIGAGTGPAYQPPQQPSTYLGDSANSGVYEQNGNVWENGNWWNANNDVWSNELANWFKPQDLNQAWQDIQQHDNSQFPNEITPTAAYGQVPVGRADFVNYDLNQANQRNDNPRAAFLDYDLGTMPQKDDRAWWEKGLDAATGFAGDVLNSKPAQIAGQGIGHVANIANPGSMALKQLTGYGAGDAFNDYNNWVGDPIAETGAQLTPFIPGITQSMLAAQALGGPRFQDSASGGLGELGSALKESGGNPLDFAKAQNANFDERPMWQQFGAQAAFDPTNLVPGIGMVNYGGDVARAGVKGAKALGALETGIEEFPTIGKLAGSEVGELRFGKKAIGAADEALNEPRRKLLDALTEQHKFRTSGQADELIHQGRVTQAEGISGAIGSMGDNFTENLDAMRGGARVGKLLPPTEPLALDEATMAGLLREGITAQGDDAFKNLNLATALDKVNKGIYVQPKELATLREVYGDEVAELIARTNDGRIRVKAQLTPEDEARIARQAEIDGKRIARLEVEAEAQHRHADKLLEQSRLNPTKPHIKAAAEDARARAIAKANEANRLMAERAEKLVAEQEKRAAKMAQDEATRANRKEVTGQLAKDKKLAAEEAKVRKAAEDEWVKALDDQADPYATMMNKNEERTNRFLSKEQEAAKKRAGDKAVDEWDKSLNRQDKPDAFAKQQAKSEATAQKQLAKEHQQEWAKTAPAKLKEAHATIDEAGITPALKQAYKDVLDTQVRSARAVLDGYGDKGPGLIRRMYAAAVGEVSDSWTSKLLSERAIISNSLESSGMDSAMAGQLAESFQEIALRRRFGGNIPQHVQDSLDQASGVTRGADGEVLMNGSRPAHDMGHEVAAGTAHISQAFKNTQLGIGDVAVVAQNLGKMSLTDMPQVIAGSVNRLLHLFHAGMDTALEGVPRSARYVADGLQPKTITSGITDLSKEGTLISLIPKVGKTLDVPFVKTAEFLTNLQYKHILGTMREVVFEGNLVLAKAAGEDITDPLVRRQAAQWANASSGGGKLAQRATRREVEKASLLTPGMTRAQIQKPGQIARGIGLLGNDAAWVATFGKVAHNMEAGTKAQRLYAATTIASTGLMGLAVGKLLNDQIGLEEFEFDPSKPGFGDITLKGGTVVNVFAQEQITKTVARSFRILAEGGVGKDDITPLLEEWGKLGIGRSSPPLKILEGYLGTGYQPGEGYKFGDLNMSPKDAFIGATVPPLIQDTMRNGFDPVRTPLEALGFNSFPEGTWSEFYRELESKGQSSDTFWKKTPAERDAFFAANPKAKALMDQIDKDSLAKAEAGRDPEAEKTLAFNEAEQTLKEQIGYQSQDDSRLASGGMSPDQWWNYYSDRKKELGIRNDQTFSQLDLQTKDPKLAAYYAAIDATKAGNGGRPDWDEVEKYKATLSQADQEYLATHTGLIKIDTPQVRAMEKIHDDIEASGYFERVDENWAKVSKTLGITGYDSYYDWRNAEIDRLLGKYGYDRSDVNTVAEINKYLDKQEPAQGMDYYRKQWNDKWVMENPEAAYHAWQLGFYNPIADIKNWLAAKFEKPND